MAETSIEWTQRRRPDGSVIPGYTFNPWRGCTEVEGDPACDNCYARTLSKRNPKVLGVWGDDGHRSIAAESYWKGPQTWAVQARALGERRIVFCASLGDVGEDRPELVEQRARLCDVIDATADALIWMLLTKRIENVGRFFPDDVLRRCGVGVTTATQRHADERIAKLLLTPAGWRFISAEPLLEHITIPDVFLRRLDWGQGPKHWPDGAGVLDLVIGGGETDSDRPTHPSWARSLRDQCAPAGVAFHWKQWGDWGVGSMFEHANIVRVVLNDGRAMTMAQYAAAFSQTPGALEPTLMAKVGKHQAGRLLDGTEWHQFPEVVA